ncbi:MAG: hypothetical protein AAFW89_14135 [Bacteroidota bacterium]
MLSHFAFGYNIITRQEHISMEASSYINQIYLFISQKSRKLDRFTHEFIKAPKEKSD